MFFLLVAGHALADFALQSDAMATCKCRRANLPLQKEVPWYYWMLAHGLIHGATVTLVLRACGIDFATALVLGQTETLVHILIDIAKCERLTNIHIDQALHIACKGLWCAMIAYAWI